MRTSDIQYSLDHIFVADTGSLGFIFARCKSRMFNRIPDAWPKCQGDVLPSLDNSGILVQMVHRIGAGVVGLALIFGVMKFKENARSRVSTMPILNA